MKNTERKTKGENMNQKLDQRLMRQIKAEMYIHLPTTGGEIKHRDAALSPGLTELIVKDVSGKVINRVICSAWEYNLVARIICAYNAEQVYQLPDKF